MNTWQKLLLVPLGLVLAAVWMTPAPVYDHLGMTALFTLIYLGLAGAVSEVKP
jgi:hypothetical protein